MHQPWLSSEPQVQRLRSDETPPPQDSQDGDGRDKMPDADLDRAKPTDGEFPDVDRCLVIIGGLEDECSRRLQKVRLREV